MHLDGSSRATRGRPYDGTMQRPDHGFRARLRYHGRAFFTNWTTYEAPVWTKLGLTVKNRTKALVSLHGCCGNHGQPGC